MEIKIREIRYRAIIQNGQVVLGDAVEQVSAKDDTLTLDEEDPDLQRAISTKAYEVSQHNQKQKAMAAKIHQNNPESFTITLQILDIPTQK